MPVGDQTKPIIRSKCKEWGLPVASRPDSQDLCFLGDENYRKFYRKYSKTPVEPGDIVDTSGNVIGKHTGLIDYTIGQRKGIRVSASAAYYVVAKISEKNQLVIGDKSEAGKDQIFVKNTNWIVPASLWTNEPKQVQVRYSAKAEQADILVYGDEFTAQFSNPVPNISPGQAGVIYMNEICLGGGIIV